MAHFLVYSKHGDTAPAACADADTCERVQTLPGDTVVQLIRGTCIVCDRQIGYTPTGTEAPFAGHVQYADERKFEDHPRNCLAIR